MSERETIGTEPGEDTAQKKFLVVGVGGSAGAIASFREFFRHVPSTSGMAYVVILHLSPEYDSHLAEVLQAVARIPVVQVRTSVHVEPDRVYVIPPNKSLEMNDGQLIVSSVTSYEERRAPIDIFFRTLADTHDSSAVCVVMSGSGSDGSMGLRRVKEYNGLVLVQDPAEAAFGEMPRNCIATGLVDFVVPVADMPQRILHYRDQLRTLSVPDDTKERPEDDEQALTEVFTLLRLRTGHDFTNYKRPTVLRRIERRMAVRDVDTLPAYAAFLRERHEEAHALLAELLISVTNFFRDREVWEKVELNILPKLLASKRAEDHLRVWVPGCATGEEAYSIAMLLAEKAPPNLQIFATDLDEHAIARARDGWYSDTEVADVPPERLRRFFLKDGAGYRVRRELREIVLFAHHNLIKDPPFSHLDFISCRNLLIYLNRGAQQRALEVMHFALEPDGYLLLGTAEAVDGSPSLYSLVDKEAHVYRARAVERAMLLPPLPRAIAPIDTPALLATDVTPPELKARDRFAPIDLHHRLLEEYAAPSVVVDDQYNIVHLSERAGRYLQFPRGEATSNVLNVVRQELRIDLRSALFQAAQKRTIVAARNVVAHTSDREERIDLVVRPALTADDPARGFFLILFEEANRGTEMPAHEATAVEPGTRQLDEELLRVKAQMRATIEQYEVQAEEARAANEELQAMNEELRSTAEELETSQEELQSVNEELQTVNQELKVKIDEISHASDDLRNLMSSTDIGTIFVDRALRVKLFTPGAREVFNLISADVGRPLSDITHKLDIDGLGDAMARVLERLQTIEQEVQTRDGAWYLMRLLPYRTSEDRIDGVVLTFLDITERHKAEAALRRTEERYRTLFVSMDEGYAVVEVMANADGAWSDFRFLEVNPAFEKQSGMHNAAGRTATEILGTPNPRWAQIYGKVAESGEPSRFEETEPVLGRTFDLYAFRLGDPHNHRVAVLFMDITRRKRDEAALRESQAQFHAIANVVPDLLWMSEPSGETTWYNDRWLAYTGQSREQARGWGWTEAIHPEDRARSVEQYARAVAEARPLQQEHRIRGASGEYRWFLINAAPLRDHQGRVIRYYAAATDLHAQRMAREELEERVRERTQALLDLSLNRQQLLERLVTAAEEERQRIARELHDEMGQHITALRVGLESLKPRDERITELKAIITRIDQSIDRLTLELRPPALDQLGLHGAISSLADEFSAASGIRVAVHLGIGDGDRFSDAIESTLYRVVQESLTNVWKHAAATTVSVILERERDILRLIVEDNGRGFDAAPSGDGVAPRGRFGLLGIRERLALVRGTLDLESQPGSGTTMFARVPLPETESAG
ncbi:MAG: PAS domain S-box protein [Acidobacteria bacterium]|nr:PAS domain S-box protein [Acidobacteriota bacterium]MBV9475388.1 PAS domain S-box protein [Acidobacteriota bacterium]